MKNKDVDKELIPSGEGRVYDEIQQSLMAEFRGEPFKITASAEAYKKKLSTAYQIIHAELGRKQSSIKRIIAVLKVSRTSAYKIYDRAIDLFGSLTTEKQKTFSLQMIYDEAMASYRTAKNAADFKSAQKFLHTALDAAKEMKVHTSVEDVTLPLPVLGHYPEQVIPASSDEELKAKMKEIEAYVAKMKAKKIYVDQDVTENGEEDSL